MAKSHISRKAEPQLQVIIDVLNLAQDGADLTMIKQVLVGYEDLDRVRQCVRCKRIFFAKQVRSRYHSERCRGADANRILRSQKRLERYA